MFYKTTDGTGFQPVMAGTEKPCRLLKDPGIIIASRDNSHKETSNPLRLMEVILFYFAGSHSNYETMPYRDSV